MKLEPERDSLPRLLAFVYMPLALLGVWAIEQGWLWRTGQHQCVMLERLGIACPTCGGTRSVLAFSRFQLTESFLNNPLVTVGLLILAAWTIWALAATVIPRWRVRLVIGARLAKKLRLGVGLLILMTWIYEIVRHL